MPEHASPTIRRARPEDRDAVAELIYETSADGYERFAGGREQAIELIRAAYEAGGTDASVEVVTVADVDGRVAGAMASFPVSEARDRSYRFLRLVLRRRPPWRWLGVLRLWWVGARAAPAPPVDSLYVDALATRPEFRRRGVGRALLAHAERQARQLGLAQVALDTAKRNAPALALYRRAGFEVRAESGPVGPIPALVGLVKPVR
ncbi:MAG: GNAT family N-acetyltransferase [Thermoleophilaceae bacterium]|nr:GNAT family N-acetyltransferase [Thermoleophilaceae bacterium]